MARTYLMPFGFGGSDPILSLHREMNRMFDDVLRTGMGGRGAGQDQGSGQAGFFTASMNVSETEKELRVTVELPGVSEQDIDVDLNDDVLTIRGEKKFEDQRGGEKEDFHAVERAYGTFQRSLRLPFQANPDEVRASFQNGVLTITVPKSAQQARSRRIQIQGGASQGGQRQGEQGAPSEERTIGDRSGGEGGQGGDQQPATH
jgi:HSP20 family protein